MNRFAQFVSKRKRWLSAGVLFVFAACVVASQTTGYGARVGVAKLLMDNNYPNQTALYRLSFKPSTVGEVGSIFIEFCSNDPHPEDPCTDPPGLDLKGVSLQFQSGTTGFSILGTPTATGIILTRPPAPVSNATIMAFEFAGAKNPSSIGSYYVRVTTYASSDATGSYTDFGGIGFAIINDINVTAEVPPFLVFCSAITINNLDCEQSDGDFIDFGELSSKQARSGTSQFLTATNSGSGYSVTLSGSTMSSGLHSLAAIASPDVSRPGTSQFGMNVRSNTAPAVGKESSGPGVAPATAQYATANKYTFVPGDIIVSTDKPDDRKQYTTSYIVNVPAGQPAGIYVTTVTYICLANF